MTRDDGQPQPSKRGTHDAIRDAGPRLNVHVLVPARAGPDPVVMAVGEMRRRRDGYRPRHDDGLGPMPTMMMSVNHDAAGQGHGQYHQSENCCEPFHG